MGAAQIDSCGVGALGAVFVAAHNREVEIKLATLSQILAEVLRVPGWSSFSIYTIPKPTLLRHFSDHRKQRQPCEFGRVRATPLRWHISELACVASLFVLCRMNETLI